MFQLRRFAQEGYKRSQADLRLPLVRRAETARFDSGLVNPNGAARPALKQFKKSIKGLPR